MNKRELAVLEKAYVAEINGALQGGTHLLQTRSAIAQRLVEAGLLRERIEVLDGRFPVTVKGFELTELGRLTYCSSTWRIRSIALIY